MTGVEIILLLTGVVFMVGSFFVAEKLSPSELNKIAELSEDELKKIIDRSIADAGVKIEEAIENQLDVSGEKVDRALEKETNEKIMAISEYSDTVIENMNKTHNEIIFLYNMLNDKHTELTQLASNLQRLAADLRNVQETAAKMVEPEPQPVREQPAAEEIAKPQQPEPEENPAEGEQEKHNQQILALHGEGFKDVEIARKLGLGLGEVRLVIGLYRGDKNS